MRLYFFNKKENRIILAEDIRISKDGKKYYESLDWSDSKEEVKQHDKKDMEARYHNHDSICDIKCPLKKKTPPPPPAPREIREGLSYYECFYLGFILGSTIAGILFTIFSLYYAN